MCDALVKAGIVMRFRNTVFLRPDEVAEQVLEVRRRIRERDDWC